MIFWKFYHCFNHASSVPEISLLFGTIPENAWPVNDGILRMIPSAKYSNKRFYSIDGNQPTIALMQSRKNSNCFRKAALRLMIFN